jgi:hypothetical protein
MARLMYAFPLNARCLIVDSRQVQCSYDIAAEMKDWPGGPVKLRVRQFDNARIYITYLFL